jgi:hypothetical protein
MLDLNWRLWRHDGRKLRDSTYRPLSTIVHLAAWISIRNLVLAYIVNINQRTDSNGVAINFTRVKSEWLTRSLYCDNASAVSLLSGSRRKIEETIFGGISRLPSCCSTRLLVIQQRFVIHAVLTCSRNTNSRGNCTVTAKCKRRISRYQRLG